MINSNYKVISGWNEIRKKSTKLIQPKNLAELKKTISNLNQNQIKFSLISGGCSYGEVFTSPNGITIDLNFLNKIIKLDMKNNFIEVESAVNFLKLNNYLLKKGFYIKSLPGTLSATIGGCINGNTHGKDSYLNGPFANNLISAKILNLNGKISKYKNNKKNNYSLNNPIGSLGLKNIIISAKIKIFKLKNSNLIINKKKFFSYEELIQTFQNNKKKTDMMGAWIDHFDIHGRGVIHLGKFSNIKNKNEYKQLKIKKNYEKILRIFIYPILRLLLNKIIIKFINKFYFFVHKKDKITEQSFFETFYPLIDFIPNDKLIYKNGKVCIQIILSTRDIVKNLKRINNLCRKYDFQSWWCGMKMHKKYKGNFAFAENGFDITIQFPFSYSKKKNFNAFLSKIYDFTQKKGGKVYLVQDNFLSNKIFKKMYPEYKKFKKEKNKVDKYNLLENYLYKRLIK